MSTTPTNPQVPPEIKVGVELRKVSKTEGIVKLANGEEYSFSIFESQGKDPATGKDNWKDITSEQKWEAVAKQVGEFFEKSTQQTFETASMTLSGDLTNITPTALQEKDVKIVDAQVSYKETADAQAMKVRTFSKAQAVAFKNLNTLADEFSKSASTKSTPINSNRPAATEEYKTITKNEVLDLLKGRDPQSVNTAAPTAAPQLRTSIDYALADQLKNMTKQGRSNFSVDSHDTIITSFRKQISENIKKNSEAFEQDDVVFKSLCQSLKSAEEKNDQALDHALNAEPKHKGFIKQKKITPSVLSQLLSDFSRIQKGQRKDLVNLYAEYIRQGGATLDDTFFKAFTNCFGTGDNPDNFQIVVIKDDGAKVSKVTAYPLGTKDIVPSRCLFIHYDTVSKEYKSYPRAVIPNATIDAAKLDLNSIKARYNPETQTTRELKIPLKTIDAGGGGRCLDLSVAKQILKKRGINDERASIALADYLRKTAANKIKEAEMDNDVEFINTLITSINSIPDLGADLVASAILTSHNSNLAALQDAITAIGNQNVAPAQKKLLRDFYADYITYSATQSGPMQQYLDSAFLYVLPKIAVRNEDKSQFNHYNCAVFTGDIFGGKFPQHIALDGNFIFVHHNDGSLHYQMIDRDDQNTNRRIEQEKQNDASTIQQLKLGEQTVLAALLQSSLDVAQDHDQLKAGINTGIRINHPLLFNALAQAIYDYDVAQATANNSQAPVLAPNTSSKDYGAGRLQRAAAQDVKAILASFAAQNPTINVAQILTNQA